MTAENFRRLEAIFHRALEAGGGPERDRFIEQQCPEHLRDSLRLLLASDAGEQEPAPADPPVLPRFGPYQAETVLGSGGAGIVYLARRADGQFETSVAVKVLRAASRSEYFRRRFLFERQVLAQLKHPNIAALLDGGILADGEPWLAMEFVEGEPLDVFCDRRRLKIAERLRLFRQLLDGVAYAHSHLVVHQDFKPSNILVTADLRVKIVDFGTSRFDREVSATQSRLLTPSYASPEQLRGERVSTLSDIYSLGVVLYRLLSGTLPQGDRRSIVATIERALDHTEPPALHAAASAEAAALCSTTLSELRRSLRGDLSSIAAAATAWDPSRRYQSAIEFAADIDAFLGGRPVKARPWSWFYAASKFVSRHTAGVAAAAIGTLALLATGVVAQRASQRADREALLREREVQSTLLRVQRARNSSSLARTEWDLYSASLQDPAPALEKLDAAIADYELVPARIYDREWSLDLPTELFDCYVRRAQVLVELGRGREGLEQLVARWPRLSGFLKKRDDVANLAAWEDMLSDRLGASARLCDEGNSSDVCRVWKAMAWGTVRQLAIGHYRDALPLVAQPALLHWHYGDLLRASGNSAAAVPLLESARAHFDNSARRDYRPEFRPQVETALGRAELALGMPDAALREFTSALRSDIAILDSGTRSFPAERLRAYLLIERGSLLLRLHRPGALESSRTGLNLLLAMAEVPGASTDVIDAAASALLTVEPAELRHPLRARELADAAIRKSHGAVARYLVTFAAATGAPADLRRAARAAYEEGQIVRPLIPQGALGSFDENQSKLLALGN